MTIAAACCIVASLSALPLADAGQAAPRKLAMLRAGAVTLNVTTDDGVDGIVALGALGAKDAAAGIADIIALNAMEAQEPLQDFVPRCVPHVKSLVSKLGKDNAVATLLHECDVARSKGPGASGFRSHEACLEFSERLARCRTQEIETGKVDQYEAFCREYHQHLETGALAGSTQQRRGREQELEGEVRDLQAKVRALQGGEGAAAAAGPGLALLLAVLAMRT